MTGLCLASVCQFSHNESGWLVWSHLNQNFIKVAALKKKWNRFKLLSKAVQFI